MMGLPELCARNVSAAIRETLNAQIAAQRAVEAAKTVAGHPPFPDGVVDKINEARLLLEVAQQSLSSR